MESVSLKRFTERYGAVRSARTLGMTRQAIHSALKKGRDIQIVDTGDGYISMHETKLLRRIEGSFPEVKR